MASGIVILREAYSAIPTGVNRARRVRLHQIKIDYSAEQDRLLMLVSTDDQAEVRLWLTRRYLKLLWPVLLKLAEDASPRVKTQASPEARQALLGMEHEQAVQRADFSKPFEAQPRATPLGSEPLLLARIQAGRDARGMTVLSMHPSSGKGVSLTLDDVLLHSVCRLLHGAAERSGWELTLNLPGTGLPAADTGAPRVLN